jgi:DNA-binding transcriptional regulator YiaG
MLHVRKAVLDLNQAEFAKIAGTSQGTVSKWEAGELEPDRDQLALIRAEIRRRGIEWDDRWFFEAPSEPTRIAS